MDQAFKNKVLIVSAADAVRQMVASYVREDQIVQFKSLDEVDAKLEALGDGLLFCVICDATTLEKEVIEIGQLIHNQCPKTPSFIVTTRREGFNPKGYIKNGFSEAFLLPLDEPEMKQKVTDTISAEALAARSLRSVMADDIHASTELDFDTFVFLPLNKKYVRYFSSKGSVSEDRLGRLKKGNHRRLYVDQKDIGRFYNYTAEQMLKIGKTDNSMSETEKVEKLQTSVRHLFTDLFEDVGESASISEGKDRWINCQKIVSSYITNGEGDWYSRLLKAAGGISGGYSKATGVSSIAALLGIGLGLKTVEDLAIAGMLCDLGLPWRRRFGSVPLIEV